MARPVSVNVADVASRANVSIASVSRVLNNQKGVSEKLRSKIRMILEDDGRYSNHVSERGVKLAVAIEMEKPHISTYTSTLLTGIAEYALHNNIDISTGFVSTVEKSHTDFLRILRERHCDGMILLVSKTLSSDEFSRLADAKIAVMALNGRCENKNIGFLYTNPNVGMTLLLNHLADQGHRNIAFLAGPQEDDSDNSQRVETFKQHHKAAGNKLAGKLLSLHQPTRYAQEAGYLQALDVIKRCPQLTAIIANNDEMAYGAMLACHESNCIVPADVSVVGFDDYPGSQYTVPPLTTVRQHLNEVGYKSAEAIHEYICGTTTSLPRKVLKPELIVRGSTAAVHKTK